MQANLPLFTFSKYFPDTIPSVEEIASEVAVTLFLVLL